VDSGWTDAQWDEWNAANADFYEITNFYYSFDNPASENFITTFGMTPEQVGAIVEELQFLSGIDIPAEHESKVTSLDSFFGISLQVAMVEKAPAKYGLGMDGIGQEKGTGPSDFGYADKWLSGTGALPDEPRDVTSPGDAVYASSANSPGSEGVENAIDGQPTKYLNFDGNNSQPSGFVVTPGIGSTTITGISMQTANDAPDRDVKLCLI
jgi:hypothetical protein